MHRSRLGEITIDCNTDDLGTAASFWSEALGCAMERRQSPSSEYYSLKTDPNEVQINVQRVSHPSWVHLDIETDDIDAEVRRLERLGATRVRQVRHWWVMEAPTGHRLCVGRQARSEFPREGNEWP